MRFGSQMLMKQVGAIIGPRGFAECDGRGGDPCRVVLGLVRDTIRQMKDLTTLSKDKATVKETWNVLEQRTNTAWIGKL